MYEVAPYVYRINAGPILPSSTLAISLKAWSVISAEDQAIIMEVSRDSLKWTGEMLDAREAEIRKIWQETAGVHYAEFPAAARAEWAANSPDFLGNLAKKLDEAGMPGTPIADRIKELVAGYNSGELKMPE